jgi:branched-chain amino acid transport system ATP-binding protein
VEKAAIEIRGLTARFGGLTAIAALDLSVQSGQITSIIGPNGAGKTTLFNCISGVLTPTAGTILVMGRDLRRPWSMKTTWACLGAGFLTAALCGCLALDVNGLWRAAIRRPSSFSPASFTTRAMIEGVASYWRGELALERGSLGRWNVVTADGAILLATADAHEQARRLRDEYGRVDQKVTHDRHDLLVAIADAARARRWRTCAATLAGALLGALGLATAWKRTRWTPEVVAAAGVARTFQNLRLFSRLTVLENVLVACESRRQQSPRAEAARLLELVGLSAAAARPAAQLAYGDRRRLEIARALGQRPWLLLLDEPAAGMNAIEKGQLKELIRRLRDAGITIVLIEHEMSLVMEISDHVVALANGRKIAAGPPDAVRRHPDVIEAYLGIPAE